MGDFGTPKVPPKNNGGGGGGNNSAIAALLKAILGGSTGPIPNWASKAPTSTPQLQRQLSANVGQMTMPGGPVGALLQPSFGSSRPATTNFDPSKYGQQPGYGEATFFKQSMLGGMTPLSGLSPFGVPQGWNPFGGYRKRINDGKGGDGKGDGKGGGGGGKGGGGGNPSGGSTIGDLVDGGK